MNVGLKRVLKGKIEAKNYTMCKIRAIFLLLLLATGWKRNRASLWPFGGYFVTFRIEHSSRWQRFLNGRLDNNWFLPRLQWCAVPFDWSFCSNDRPFVNYFEGSSVQCSSPSDQRHDYEVVSCNA